VPFSISWRAASSGEREGAGAPIVVEAALLREEERDGLAGGAAGAVLKPIVLGGCSRSFFSTLMRARSAMSLMMFMMSSMRDWVNC